MVPEGECVVVREQRVKSELWSPPSAETERARAGDSKQIGPKEWELEPARQNCVYQDDCCREKSSKILFHNYFRLLPLKIYS